MNEYRRHRLAQTRFEVAATPHAGLWFDKFLGEPTTLAPARQGSPPPPKPEAELVRQTAQIPESADYARCYHRWRDSLRAVRARAFQARAHDRVVIGTGNESVSETAITLHRTYGVPYLPGSALKGLAARFACDWLGPGQPAWKCDGLAYRTVFGAAPAGRAAARAAGGEPDIGAAGYVSFFDALYVPGSAPRGTPLDRDVLTVHHPSYYSGAAVAPADWDSPNPVSFLTASGSYLVVLGFAAGTDDAVARRWLDLTFGLLAHALLALGIGAKTAAGYGRLTLNLREPEFGPPISKAPTTPAVNSTQVAAASAVAPRPAAQPARPPPRIDQEFNATVLAVSETEARLALPGYDANLFVTLVPSAAWGERIFVKNTQAAVLISSVTAQPDGTYQITARPRPKKEKGK